MRWRCCAARRASAPAASRRWKACRSTDSPGNYIHAVAKSSGRTCSKRSSGPDMFTGIVTDVGEVRSVKPRADNLHRITIACDYPRAELIEGASIACSGVCLTVVGTGEEDGRTWFAADAAAETLAVTSAGRWHHGTRLNLERALKVGDELGGHMMAGHVDGLAEVIARADLPDMARIAFR